MADGEDDKIARAIVRPRPEGLSRYDSDLARRGLDELAGLGIEHRPRIFLVSYGPKDSVWRCIHSLESLLTKNGYQVATAYWTDGAIQAATRFRPRLIILQDDRVFDLIGAAMGLEDPRYNDVIGCAVSLRERSRNCRIVLSVPQYICEQVDEGHAPFEACDIMSLQTDEFFRKVKSWVRD